MKKKVMSTDGLTPPTFGSGGRVTYSTNLSKISPMSRSIVELDFFLLEKKDSTASSVAAHKSSVNKIFTIFAINPELLKRYIASGSAEACSNADVFAPNKSFSVPSTPKDGHISIPALPVYRNGVTNEQNHARSAPLTIFYNGTVSMFDVTQKQAENILKLAQEEGSKAVLDPKLAVSPTGTQNLLPRFNGDVTAEVFGEAQGRG